MIKNIIFDFGGVIYDIDHIRTKNAFINLGVDNFDELYGHAIQAKLFEDFEIGIISPSNFIEELSKFIPNSHSNMDIDNAWNALLIGFKLERFELLEKAKNHYKLYLLSNTNQIHYQKYMLELEYLYGQKKFFGFFEKLYFSHQIGMRKPDLKIFDYVIRDNNINPDETVFIDDYELNITAAKNCRLEGILLNPNQEVSDLFTNDGFLKYY